MIPSFLTSGKFLTRSVQYRGRVKQALAHTVAGMTTRKLESFLAGMDSFERLERSDWVVSLTSWAPRARTLPLVLVSLLEQTVRPREIFVWLAPADRDMLSRDLVRAFENVGVTFMIIDDLGPHKKWWPMLTQVQCDKFVIADDDTFYPSNWLKALTDESSNDFVICHRAHEIVTDNSGKIAPYSHWLKNIDSGETGSHSTFATGCGGVVIKRENIPDDFLDRSIIESLCPVADDVWLKAAYMIAGVTCKKSEYYFPALEYPGSQNVGLFHNNVDHNDNDRQLERTFAHFEINLADFQFREL